MLIAFHGPDVSAVAGGLLLGLLIAGWVRRWRDERDPDRRAVEAFARMRRALR